MSKFQNLKIAITPEQPLDEVVRELERLGFKHDRKGRWVDRDQIILTTSNSYYTKVDMTFCRFYKPTTLTELKEME